MAARSMTKRKTSDRKKSATKKSFKSPAGRKKTTSTRKKSTDGRREYSPAASDDVRDEMREYKSGTARSGRSGAKVKSRKQAIAIGLSKARRSGKKVPPKPGGGKKS